MGVCTHITARRTIKNGSVHFSPAMILQAEINVVQRIFSLGLVYFQLFIPHFCTLSYPAVVLPFHDKRHAGFMFSFFGWCGMRAGGWMLLICSDRFPIAAWVGVALDLSLQNGYASCLCGGTRSICLRLSSCARNWPSLWAKSFKTTWRGFCTPHRLRPVRGCGRISVVHP